MRSSRCKERRREIAPCGDLHGIWAPSFRDGREALPPLKSMAAGLLRSFIEENGAEEKMESREPSKSWGGNLKKDWAQLAACHLQHRRLLKEFPDWRRHDVMKDFVTYWL